MPSFRYRAMTQVGEIVSGSLAAPNAAEVAQRIEYLGLIPIETVTEQGWKEWGRRDWLSSFTRPRSEDVTTFTGDLALLMRTGARINEALELLHADAHAGRMRSTVSALGAGIMSGESLAEAIARHPAIFPPIYVALVRVGETSGTLATVLESLCEERRRTEALFRRLGDALRYPAFLLIASGAVFTFFLTVVLPQFTVVFRDFGTKLDPVLATFLSLSDFLRGNVQGIGAGLLCGILVVWLALRHRRVRAELVGTLARLPLLRPVLIDNRTVLFCRNLGLLLSSGVTLTASLRILAEMMAVSGQSSAWQTIVDTVRHGGKLSDALAASQVLPPLAVRTLRLGEGSGQLPMLAGRVADFYETKLQRSLDRIMGIVGPLAILVISVVVGGLIVSIMTALLSVNQMVG